LSTRTSKGSSVAEVNPYDVSSEEMAAALIAVRPTLTQRQLTVFGEMYGAQEGFHAIHAGLADVLGNVGGKLTEYFGSRPDPKYQLSWLAYPVDRNGRKYWQLRENVVNAFSLLGWFGKATRLPKSAEAGGQSLRVAEVVSQLSKTSRRLLHTMSSAPVYEMSSSELAIAMGWRGGIAANGAIGRLGRSFYKHLGHPEAIQPGEFEWWHVVATGRNDPSRGFVWRLRPYVVEALRAETYPLNSEELGVDVPPIGVRNPQTEELTIIEIARDERVRRWVASNAKGRCEACEKPAPFTGADGLPFLEVHHLKTLAEGGSDQISNAVAVCPNCHRELHQGKRAIEVKERLYSRVPRLIAE
jgi:predicted HNH restriction endonuclease